MDQNDVGRNAILDWLAEQRVRPGRKKIPSKCMYKVFVGSEKCRSLLLIPSQKSFTSALSTQLPKAKTGQGTIFLCEVDDASIFE